MHANPPTLQHAYQRGAKGMARDALVLASRWRFDPAEIQCRWACGQGWKHGCLDACTGQAWLVSAAAAALRAIPPTVAAWPPPHSVAGCRTQVWQGLEDETVPLPHAKFYANTVPGAQLRVQVGGAASHPAAPL